MARRAGAKRASEVDRAGPGRPAKKSKTDPNADKCEIVVEAIRDHQQSLPPTVVKMLCVAAPNSLTVNAENRHAAQVSMVGMIGQVINHISAQLEADVAEKQAPVSTANEDKVALDTKVTVKEAEHESLKGAVLSASEAMAHAKTAFDEATQALAQAKLDQAQGDASLNQVADKMEELESALHDTYNLLKEQAADKNAINILMQLGKKYKLEETLLGAAPTAFQKEPGDRGCFDNMVFEQFEGAFTANIKALATELAEGNAGKQIRAGAVAVAEAANAAGRSSLQASREAFAQAVAAEKAGKEAVALAKQVVNELFSILKDKMDALDGVKVTLAEFQNGGLASFLELKDLAPAAEPEPEMEAAAERGE